MKVLYISLIHYAKSPFYGVSQQETKIAPKPWLNAKISASMSILSSLVGKRYCILRRVVMIWIVGLLGYHNNAAALSVFYLFNDYCWGIEVGEYGENSHWDWFWTGTEGRFSGCSSPWLVTLLGFAGKPCSHPLSWDMRASDQGSCGKCTKIRCFASLGSPPGGANCRAPPNNVRVPNGIAAWMTALDLCQHFNSIGTCT